VSITPSGSNLGAVSAEVQQRLKGVELPAGVTAEIGGATRQQAESFRQLGLALLAAIAIVYVIMVATFKSLVQPLILLVSVPFAATGAVALLLVTRVPLGLPSLIGMLMLVGIVVTNAIVLIDLINQYRKPRGAKPGMSVADAITHGARQRLRPILMTALATVFALSPMALGMTGGGGFISQPLAIVVIGGLVSSTALTLVLVPVLYRLVEGRKEKKELMRQLKQRPGFSPADDDVDAEFADWTTGMVPKLSGRRAAPGSPE
jgi:HAE1 family hydrophobic/amphiphilic exporter-1